MLPGECRASGSFGHRRRGHYSLALREKRAYIHAYFMRVAFLARGANSADPFTFVSYYTHSDRYQFTFADRYLRERYPDRAPISRKLYGFHNVSASRTSLAEVTPPARAERPLAIGETRREVNRIVKFDMYPLCIPARCAAVRATPCARSRTRPFFLTVAAQRISTPRVHARAFIWRASALTAG